MVEEHVKKAKAAFKAFTHEVGRIEDIEQALSMICTAKGWADMMFTRCVAADMYREIKDLECKGKWISG